MSRLEDARIILLALGMPPKQRNDNGVYTFLAFAGVGPKTPWKRASDPRTTPHGVIEFARESYGKIYAENTRETIRRRAIHQFVQGGILARNPDDPSLPTNSPRTHYALTPEALVVVRAFGTSRFDTVADEFRSAVDGGLASRHAKKRKRAMIPVRLSGGREVLLSPGRHNELQRDVVTEFLPRFGGGATLLYLGDTDMKNLHVDEKGLSAIGVRLNEHDKLPDVVALDTARMWLFLIEAVTSHGPVTPKRQEELEQTLCKCKAGRVYVSAFPDLREFKRHADQIAWETEVWVADSPGHLLHYNGDRFLGPR